MFSAALITMVCVGQEAYVPQPATFRGGAWFSRLGGSLQDGTDEIDLETNVLLNDRESTPLFEFAIDPFEGALLTCSIFDFSTSGRGVFNGNQTYGAVTFSNGDNWRGAVDMQSIGFQASLDYIEPYKASEKATLTFAPVIGIRWYGIETTLENVTAGTREHHQNGWFSLQGGIDMQFTWDTSESTSLVDSIAITSELLVGAVMSDDGGGMVSVQAGIEIEFSPSFGGYFGYRLQELSVEEGNYTFEAGLQGLYVGGQIRF